jgi:hypothetical protein
MKKKPIRKRRRCPSGNSLSFFNFKSKSIILLLKKMKRQQNPYEET